MDVQKVAKFLRKRAKKGREKKECIMGKYRQTFKLSTNLALAGNGLRIRDVALIRIFKSRHNATVPYILYAVMRSGFIC